MKVRQILLATIVCFAACWSARLQADDGVFRPIYMAEDAKIAPLSYEKLDKLRSSSSQASYPAGPGYGYCRAGWRLGVEATFLAPMGGNGQSWTLNDISGGNTYGFSTDANGIGGLVPAPRIWAGYVCNNGWGFQFRYWELNTSSNYADPYLITGDNLGYTSGTNLEMYALDLEGIKEFCFWDWNMMGTFGYRHATRDYNETTNMIGLVAGNRAFTGTSSGIASFEGDGITFSLSGYQCSNCCYGLQWFWNTRGSVLFGSNYVGALTHATLQGPGGNEVQTNGGFAGANDSIFVAEFQVGAMWSAPVKCINGRFFLRGAFEYQHWSSLNSGAGATSTVGEIGVGQLTVNSVAPSDSLDLVGFAIATGITW